jgi:hypothetical protein
LKSDLDEVTKREKQLRSENESLSSKISEAVEKRNEAIIKIGIKVCPNVRLFTVVDILSHLWVVKNEYGRIVYVRLYSIAGIFVFSTRLNSPTS